jgi:hypothetical protein
MKQEHTLTKISLIVDIAAIIVLIIYYFIAVVPNKPITDLRGLLILSPPLFGIIGLITAIKGRIKPKGNLGIVLIIVNTVFLCWWPIIWVGGTLLLGP